MGERDGYRMLATGAAMMATSVVRAGVGCMQLWSETVPDLVRRAVELERRERGAGARELELRDEMIGVARDSTRLVMQELRRGVEDLDEFTRRAEPPTKRPTRPYRAKP